VLEDFAARSGLSLAFLDPKERLDRDDVRNKLQEQVIGQSAAVEALADVVSIAKARLNDPERPLAAFLFLGPTGVGKTECAKAIARTLFGDADRLLRFDLNEFNQPGAATRLVGTFSLPEGLLTSAIQRQPFAVILLDEIEKADPEVFDLLLSVLGEGRLTDSLGRTANFSNAIIIMTSNLGVREAEGNLGFAKEEDRSFAYTKAAEKFFRPEFFNRLDRVIPFKKLTRAEMATIAQRLVNEVLAREGFGQRKCVLNVAPEALERVIAAGYDPALGARAMKRAVERELTQPAASKLAELSPDELTVVTVNASDNRLTVSVQAPGWAEKVPVGERTSLKSMDRAADAWDALDNIEIILDSVRPKGSVDSGKVSVEHERYFTLKELADGIRDILTEYENRLEDNRMARLEGRQPDAVGRRARYRAMKVRQFRHDHHENQPFRSISSATSMEEALRELFDTAEPLPDDADLFELENKLALLQLMANAPSHDKKVYLWIRGFPDGIECPPVGVLARFIFDAWKTELGVEVTMSPFKKDARVEVKGFHAMALAKAGLCQCAWMWSIPGRFSWPTRTPLVQFCASIPRGNRWRMCEPDWYRLFRVVLSSPRRSGRSRWQRCQGRPRQAMAIHPTLLLGKGLNSCSPSPQG
jgi:DNA polymerase III delta prime subunit